MTAGSIRHHTAAEDDSTRHYPRHYDSLREALSILANDPLDTRLEPK